jgi:hypothetical protein
MTPISQEKRELIVAAKLCGEFTKDIEKLIGVSKSTIDKVWKLYVETGGLFGNTIPRSEIVYYARDQGKNRKYHSCKSRYNISRIDRRIKASDWRITAFSDSEIMEIFIKKKTLHPPAQKREDVIKKHSQWQENKKTEPEKTCVHRRKQR